MISSCPLSSNDAGHVCAVTTAGSVPGILAVVLSARDRADFARNAPTSAACTCACQGGNEQQIGDCAGSRTGLAGGCTRQPLTGMQHLSGIPVHKMRTIGLCHVAAANQPHIGAAVLATVLLAAGCLQEIDANVA